MVHTEGEDIGRDGRGHASQPQTDAPPPLFLVGAQRSGTTLLRLMLDHHPEISFPHEFDFAVELMSDTGEWPELERYYAFLKAHPSFRRSGLAIDPALDYPSLIESFLRQRQGGKRLVAMSVHRHCDRLPERWPEARYVHLVRDPRDVARSCLGMGWAGNAWVAIERWLEAQGEWERMRHRIPHDRRLEIRYEDLVADPPETLARICELCQVEYSSEMLTYPADTTYSPPDPELAAHWKTDLPERAVQLVEARVGSALGRWGYERSDHPPLAVGSTRGAWLRLESRVLAFRFRARRFGWTLSAAHAAARHLRIRPWQRRLEARLLALHESYVR